MGAHAVLQRFDDGGRLSLTPPVSISPPATRVLEDIQGIFANHGSLLEFLMNPHVVYSAVLKKVTTPDINPHVRVMFLIGNHSDREAFMGLVVTHFLPKFREDAEKSIVNSSQASYATLLLRQAIIELAWRHFSGMTVAECVQNPIRLAHASLAPVLAAKKLPAQDRILPLGELQTPANILIKN
jgi:hypothetical protein